jgi:cytochrome P450
MTDLLAPPVPISDLDPFSRAVLENPYEHHERLREAGPVVRLSSYGIWAMARYSEVRAVLMDAATFCSSAGVGLANFRTETPWRPPSPVLEADPPLHTRTRGVLARVLSPAVLRSLQAGFTREAIELVDRLAARGRFDAVADLAEYYPIKVFSDAMGLPDQGRHHLLAYSDIGFNAFGPRNWLFTEAMTKGEDAVAWITATCKREALAEDGFGAQIYAAVDTGELSGDEAFLIVRGFLTAGVDTTIAGLGSAVFHLAQNPQQWQLLRANPALARAAFEETVRLDSPIQTLFRTTTRAVDIAGTTIREGEKVLLSLASANRDPRRWEEPTRFDIRRRAPGHVGFGAGIHACVGQMIARIEAEAVLGALARRVEAIELDGEPQRRLNNTLRAYSHLPVKVTPADS